jgi:hypothetical protein
MNARFKFFLLAIIIFIFGLQPVFAQSVYQPYNFEFYQKFSPDLYSTQTRLQTSIKPYFIDDSLIKHTYDSLMNIGVKRTGQSLAGRKLFDGHLVDVKNNDNTFYADLLPDFQGGRDFSADKTTWSASIGAQAGGTFGPKFSYYASFYINRAAFPDYIDNYINSTAYIPGEGMDRSPGSAVKNWYYSTFLFSYTPIKYINLTLGKDKTFIGDGYRSMLLSDFASNYPFLKATATVGNVRYMAMYAYLSNPEDPAMPYNGTINKWGYFQYLSWNVSKRISLGFFQSTIEATQDANGVKQGFNPSFASPFVFLVPLDNIDNNPAKNLLGLTGKYKIFDKAIIYGQFALNEFHAKDFFSNDGAVDNKYGYQLGFRGADLLDIKGFNYLAEFNTARPYTYASFDQTSNYSQDGQPLADPFGANFREWLGILNYSIGRFDFQGHLEYAYFGLDEGGLDYGQDIFEPYTNAAKPYGNIIGQGLRTNFYYAEGNIAFLVNPKYNLRFEVGALYRDEKNSDFNDKTPMITIGLRSSFRNIYTDF